VHQRWGYRFAEAWRLRKPVALASRHPAKRAVPKRYSHRNGVQVFILLRTLALNLLRCNGFRSIRVGLMAAAHNISPMRGWVGISAAGTQ
jgi:hypothetical protein